jgi:hypothetical protein
MLQRLDPAFAGLVADEAMPAFQHFYQANRNMPNGSGFGPPGITALVWLTDRIAGTTQGNDAITGFLTLNAWDATAVRDAMKAMRDAKAHGASNAYVVAYARSVEATAKDTSFVLRSLEQVSLPETRVALQSAAAADVRALAENDLEMAWVAQKVCGPLGSELLATADGHLSSLAQMGMDGYLASKSWEEKRHGENLRNQVADDSGLKLLKHVIALIKIAPDAGLAPAMQEQLVALAQDEPSCLAIQAAIEKHPELLRGDGLKDVVELVEALRNNQRPTWGDKSTSRFPLTAGDVGKLGFLASRIGDVAVKALVLDKLEPLLLEGSFDWTAPEAMQEITKVLEGFRNNDFARLIGLNNADLDKAISSTKRVSALASRTSPISKKISEWQQEKMLIGLDMSSKIEFDLDALELSQFAAQLFSRHAKESFFDRAQIESGLSEIKLLRQQNRDGNVALRYKVSDIQFEKGLKLLEKAFEEVLEKAETVSSLTAEDFAAVDHVKAEAARLNDELGKMEAFGRSTFMGGVMRLLGAGTIVLCAISSLEAFIRKPDPVAGLKTAVLSLFASQQVSEMLVSLRVVGPTSAFARYASAKIGGVRADVFASKLGMDASKLKIDGGVKINGVPLGLRLLQAYAVLEAFDALRSGLGIWGSPQDTGAAVFSGVSAVGFGMWAVPALEAASWTGPVGLAILVVAAVGRPIYEGVKDAHQYEKASEICLRAAGFNDAAAAKLSRQAGYLSAAAGTGQMSFLEMYARYRGMTMVALRDWINGLTKDQLSNLSDNVLEAIRPRTQWAEAAIQKVYGLAAFSMRDFEKELVRDKVLDPAKIIPDRHSNIDNRNQRR